MTLPQEEAIPLRPLRRGGYHVKTQIVYTLCKDMVYTMLGIANANIDSEGGRSPTELSIFAARLAAPQTRIAIN